MRVCTKKSNIVGVLIYSDTPSKTDPTRLAIDEYADKFNRRSAEWIQSRFFEHIHLCCGSDMVIGVLALSAADIFGDITRVDIANPAQYNKNADAIKLRIIEIARERIPFVFSFAKEIRYIYGSPKEAKIHMELSWLLAGRKYYGKRESVGILPLLYSLFESAPACKVLIQIIVPDGSINCTSNRWYRYWDIKFHISSCGKIEDGESSHDALIRETAEEIDLDISHTDASLQCIDIEGICIHYCKLNEFICADYFADKYAKWQGFIYCKQCRQRYFSHKSRSPTL